jgi:hypothetical protein
VNPVKRASVVTAIALILITLVMIPAEKAHACSCVGMSPRFFKLYDGPKFGNIDVIFEGIATKTVDTFPNNVPVSFRVSAVYMGDVALGSVVDIQDDWGCGTHQKYYEGHVYSLFVMPAEQSSSADFISGCGKDIIGPLNHERYGLPEPERLRVTGTADASPASLWPPVAIGLAIGVLLGSAATLILKRSR